MKRNNVPSRVIKRTKKRLIAFGWYGGKYSHLDWLLARSVERQFEGVEKREEMSYSSLKN